MPNPVLGLCPCCENPHNSTFMQSIHSDGLFKMLLKRGEFKRDFLFCNKCIDWAKAEVLRLGEQPPQNPQYSPISEVGGSRSTPDHSLLVDPMNDPMMDSDTVVGQRLAYPTDSPLHRLGNPMSAVNYIPYHEDNSNHSNDPLLLQYHRNHHMIAPLPSPLADLADPWREMNDDTKSNDKSDHINL